MKIDPARPVDQNVNKGGSPKKPGLDSESGLPVDSFAKQEAVSTGKFKTKKIADMLSKNNITGEKFEYHAFDHFDPRRVIPGEKSWIIGHHQGIQAIDIESGEKMWETEGFNGASGFPPTPHGLRLGYADNTIAALDTDRGDIKWRLPLFMKRGDAWEGIHGISTEGILVFGQWPAGDNDHPGKLTGINTKDGTRSWVLDFDRAEQKAQHFMANKDTFISYSEGEKPRFLGPGRIKIVKVCARDMDSGKTKWEKSLKLPSVRHKMVDKAGNFCLASGNRIYFLNSDGQSRKLKLGRDDEIKGFSPARDERTVIAHTERAVHIIDTATGKERFSIKDLPWLNYSYLGEDGTVFLENRQKGGNCLTAYDGNTGEELWSQVIGIPDTFVITPGKIYYHKRRAHPSEVIEINPQSGDTKRVAQFDREKYDEIRHIFPVNNETGELVVETKKGLLYFNNQLARQKVLQELSQDSQAAEEGDETGAIIEGPGFVEIGRLRLPVNEK